MVLCIIMRLSFWYWSRFMVLRKNKNWPDTYKNRRNDAWVYKQLIIIIDLICTHINQREKKRKEPISYCWLICFTFTVHTTSIQYIMLRISQYCVQIKCIICFLSRHTHTHTLLMIKENFLGQTFITNYFLQS